MALIATIEGILHNHGEIQEILPLLQEIEPEQRHLLVTDILAFALNNNLSDLETEVEVTFPDFTPDDEFIEDLWIFSQIFDRPDIAAYATESLQEFPLAKFLPIAIIEDHDPSIQSTLLTGNFTEQEMAIALVAAFRMGNEEMVNYLGSFVGPYWYQFVSDGLMFITLRGATIPYRLLFQESIDPPYAQTLQ